ncbi:MAG: lipocalin-like domain-containing protein [Vicinamibacterales bacterium]
MMRFVFGCVLFVSLASVAAAQSVVGTYKLTSFTTTFTDGAVAESFGAQPSGYVIITPTRFMTIFVGESRSAGTADSAKVALYNSLISYTGLYHVEGTKLVTEVDVSWNQAWTGTAVRRTFTIEGRRLTLVTDPAPAALDPSRTASSRLVWERVE